MKDWLEKELDSMSQEKWNELFIKLIDKYHQQLLLLDKEHKNPHYSDNKTTEELVEDLKLHRKFRIPETSSMSDNHIFMHC